MNQKTKKITFIAMICAISYVVMAFFRVPVVLFLKYEAKDVFITIGGFVLGPSAAFITSLVIALIEMITVSDTGIIGAVMNFVSSFAFAGTASLIYKKNRNVIGGVVALFSGAVIMTAVMLLWNYLLTPLYMEVPRQQIAGMLLPYFLPFNLLKGVLNAAITLLIYKPVVRALRRSSLIPATEKENTRHINLTVSAILVILVCVFIMLIMKGIIF